MSCNLLDSSDVIYGTLNHFTMTLAFGALRRLIISFIEQQASTRDLLLVTHLFIIGNHHWKFVFYILVNFKRCESRQGEMYC
jgi:hypothetical protein